MKPALIDRLTLDVKRINAMADGIRVLTGLEDPVGEVTGMKKDPMDLLSERREYLLALLQLYMSQDLMLLLMHSDLLSSLAMPAS